MPKKIVTLVAAILLILCVPLQGLAATASPKPIEILINQVPVQSDVAPILEQGRVLVPLRVISEHFGAQVHWDDSIKTVKVAMGSKLIQLTVNQNRAYIDGQDITLDVPAKIVKERTMVPLRFVGEALGAEVHWDDANKRVLITRLAVNIINMRYDTSSGNPSLILEGDSSMEYTLWNANESQLVIDVKAKLSTPNNALYIYDDFIDRVVAGSHPENSEMARVVVELNHKAIIRDFTSNGGRSIHIDFVNALRDVEVEKNGEKLVVNLGTSMETPFSTLFLSDPDRLVVDISNSILLAEAPEVPRNDFVRDIRLGQFSTDPNVSRVVFDLKENTNYQVFQSGDVVSVIFSQGRTLSNLRVSSQGSMSLVEFEADGDIGYEVKDDRAKRQIKIVVPGVSLDKDFEEFIDIRDGIIDTIEVNKTRDRHNYNTEIIIKLSTFSSYELLTDPPSKGVKLAIYKSSIQNKVIAVDAGHGGSDPGAVVSGVQEKTINYAIATKLKALLEAQGAKVLMIREQDSTVDIYVRAGIANQARADAYISIHHNTASSPKATGTETWYYPDPEKRAFAQAVHKAVIANTGAVDREIKESLGFVVTRETRMPSALVEVGFMSNPQDMAKALDEEYQLRVAQGILQGIMDYFAGR